MKRFRLPLAFAAVSVGLLLGSAVRADTFTYDAIGRLITVASDTGATRSYVYDAADNLTAMTVATGGGGMASAQAPPLPGTARDRVVAVTNTSLVASPVAPASGR